MHPPYARAILAGFVGTLGITAVMYLVAPLMLGAPMDIAAMLGQTFGIGWAGGMLLHFTLGSLIFPAVYIWTYPVLPGSPTMRGVAFGTALWLASEVIVMPMAGAGVFHVNAGGMLAVIGSLIGHLVYGGLLGALCSVPHAHVESPART
jgi:uncharacterized membrane protein YagU involved in acid resistance